MELPTLRGDRVRLRPFQGADVVVLKEASLDSLIPKITTVPSFYSDAAALAYIERQHDRHRTGEGFSFAICSDDYSHAVGQIGVWIADLAKGRATAGYWLGHRLEVRSTVER
jgi:[ribosomal protein S5]-alanine N-acetyltransferase